MGEVFRARDERLGRDVALKLIRPASNDNPDHRRRFELEARAAASLNHPNICTIHEIGQQDGQYFIVMELLEGQTLRKRLTEGALPVRLAVDYSSQIVQGLIAAHDRQITHRDLKPENLFLTTGGRVKILDFGLAKLQPESGRPVEELTTVTRAGVLVGTPSYMSPEQVRGKKVDHRSDVFSMGSVLYEMLTGRRAFTGETELDTMIAVAAKDYPKFDLKTDISSPLREIVAYCLQKEPQYRFQSARDLATALDLGSSASKRIMDHYAAIDGRPWRMEFWAWEEVERMHDVELKDSLLASKQIWLEHKARHVWWRRWRPTRAAVVGVLRVALLALPLLLQIDASKQTRQSKSAPAYPRPTLEDGTLPAPADMEFEACPAGPCDVGGTRYFQDNPRVLYYWTGMQWKEANLGDQ
jgi:serine/threonine protein kinase